MFQWLTNCNRKRVRFIVISYLIKTVLVVIYFKYFRSNYKPIEPRLDSNISLPANISSVRRSKYSNFMAAKFFDMIPMLKNHQPMKNGDFTSHNLSKIESEVYTKNGLDKDFITKYCEKYADTFNVSNGVEKEVNAKLCFHPSEKSKVSHLGFQVFFDLGYIGLNPCNLIEVFIYFVMKIRLNYLESKVTTIMFEIYSFATELYRKVITFT